MGQPQSASRPGTHSTPRPQHGIRIGKAAVAPFVALVVYFFGLFDGFLNKIAPPVSVGLVGNVKFMALIAVLVIGVVAVILPPASLRLRIIWLVVGIALALASQANWRTLEKYTNGWLVYEFLGQKHIRGIVEGSKQEITRQSPELAPQAKFVIERILAENPKATITPQDLHQNLGRETDEIWTKESELRARELLSSLYMRFVLTMIASVVCLLQIVVEAAPPHEWSDPTGQQKDNEDKVDQGADDALNHKDTGSDLDQTIVS